MGARPVSANQAWDAPVAAPIPVARPQIAAAEHILPYLQQIDAQRWYSNFGPLATGFEARLAGRFARPVSVVTTANGTVGLTLALQALTMDAPGGLCALPAWTFAATAHAAVQAGLRPWFLDVDEETWMLDPAAVREALSDAPGRVAAVVPVAAFGRTPDLAAWADFRRETGLPVLIDAAAAFDALTEAPVPAVVSLHATKTLGVGEGGFLVAEDEVLVARVRQLSVFGFDGNRRSQVCAGNGKMSEYAAAVGHAGLDGWPAARARYQMAAQRLRIALVRTPKAAFQPGWGMDWVSSVCVVRLPHGAAGPVAAHLKSRGIDTRRWWEGGCHAMPAFAAMPRTALPVTEALARATLGLPFAADLRPEEIDRIAAALHEALAEY